MLMPEGHCGPMSLSSRMMLSKALQVLRLMATAVEDQLSPPPRGPLRRESIGATQSGLWATFHYFVLEPQLQFPQHVTCEQGPER